MIFFNIYEIFTASRINFCKYGKQKVNLQVNLKDSN